MTKIKRIISKIYFKLKPKKRLKLKEYIFVETFNARQVGGNPYYLGKYISNIENIPLVISYNNKKIDKKIDKNNSENEVYVNRLDYNFESIVNNAKYVIINNDIYIKDFNPKGYVIQTWHGTPLKKIGRDIKDFSHIKTYIYKFESQLRKTDMLLAQNEYSKDIFYRAFDKIKIPVVSGYPKNDYLFNSINKKENLKKAMGFGEFDKIILYAPTWRDDSFYKGKRAYKNLIDYKSVSTKLNPKTLFIIKPHENEKNCIVKYPEFDNVKIFKNTNLNDLMIISDKLITDYSSIYFDYMLTSKRIDFFAPDYEKYKSNLRDMYFDYDEKNLPGKIYFDESKLLKDINNFDIENLDLYFKLKEKFLPKDNGEVCQNIYKLIKKDFEKMSTRK